MDKFNKRDFKLRRKEHKVKDGLWAISYEHDKLFRLYDSNVKSNNFDSQMENLDEADKVQYEEAFYKEGKKFTR